MSSVSQRVLLERTYDKVFWSRKLVQVLIRQQHRLQPEAVENVHAADSRIQMPTQTIVSKKRNLTKTQQPR